MSTPNPIVFTPLTKGFNWVTSTTDTSGKPLPTGESPTSSTVGLRADGDTAHSLGNYKYLVSGAGDIVQLLVADPAWIAAKVPPGNYWVAVEETYTLNGATVTTGWSAEIPVSIPIPPPVIVQPLAPSNFSAN